MVKNRFVLASVAVLAVAVAANAASMDVSFNVAEAEPGDEVTLTLSGDSGGATIDSLTAYFDVPASDFVAGSGSWVDEWDNASSEPQDFLGDSFVTTFDSSGFVIDGTIATFTIKIPDTYSDGDTYALGFLDQWAPEFGQGTDITGAAPGQDATISITPEPASLGFLAFGGLAALIRRRRR